MPAAIFRVLRPLVVAFACVLIPVSAHAQTITLPLAGTIHRDQPIRPTGQQPYWVSRADCLAQDNLYFTVTLSGYNGLTLQVWAAGGVDCTPVEQRQGPAAQCWNVYSAAANTQITTVKIKATDIVARVLPGTTPPSTSLDTLCTGTTPPKGQQLSLMFLFVQAGATIVGTPQTWKDIGYDITPPAPPTNIKAEPGETRLHMSWTQNQDGDTFQYRFYCDPPPGSVLPDGGLKPLNAFRWGTISQAQVSDGGASGFGGSFGTGGSFANAGGLTGFGGITASGGSGGFSGAGGTAGAAGAVSSGGAGGTSSGGSTGAGGDTTASCNASSVLLPGIDPTFPDSLDAYICGTVGGLGISTGTTVEHLVNNVQYSVAMGAVDQVGNVGVLSPAVCATPAEVTDFFELYRGVGGKGGGGICSLSRMPNRMAGGILSAAGLLAFGGAVRRARRRRK
jgi:hypothetical protein